MALAMRSTGQCHFKVVMTEQGILLESRHVQIQFHQPNDLYCSSSVSGRLSLTGDLLMYLYQRNMCLDSGVTY